MLNKLSIIYFTRFILLGIICVIFWKIKLISFLLGRMPLWDFDVYYQTARDVLAGAHPYDLPYMETAGPPLVIAPFFLFAQFSSLEKARSVITVLTLLSYLVSCYLVTRVLTTRYRFEATLGLFMALLISFPARFTLLLGQLNGIAMLCVTLLVSDISFFGRVQESEKEKNLPETIGVSQVKPALLLLASATIKTFFAVWWLSFLKHHRKLFIWASICGVLLVLVLFPFLKPAHYWDYFLNRSSHYTLKPVQLSDIDYYNQSLRSTLGRFGLGEYAPAFFITTAIVGATYLIASGDIYSGVVLSLLLSPIVWQHYIVVVYPLLIVIGKRLWLAKNGFKRNNKKHHVVVLVFILSIFFLSVEFPWLHGRPLGGWQSLLASHYFIGLCLLETVVLYIQKRSSYHAEYFFAKN